MADGAIVWFKRVGDDDTLYDRRAIINLLRETVSPEYVLSAGKVEDYLNVHGVREAWYKISPELRTGWDWDMQSNGVITLRPSGRAKKYSYRLIWANGAFTIEGGTKITLANEQSLLAELESMLLARSLLANFTDLTNWLRQCLARVRAVAFVHTGWHHWDTAAWYVLPDYATTFFRLVDAYTKVGFRQVGYFSVTGNEPDNSFTDVVIDALSRDLKVMTDNLLTRGQLGKDCCFDDNDCQMPNAKDLLEVLARYDAKFGVLRDEQLMRLKTFLETIRGIG